MSIYIFVDIGIFIFIFVSVSGYQQSQKSVSLENKFIFKPTQGAPENTVEEVPANTVQGVFKYSTRVAY